MCLRVTPDTIHAIAKEDITVYKFGEMTSEGFIPIMYNTMVYKQNEVTTKVKFTMINNAIEQGYHSYDLATITRLMKNAYHNSPKTRVQRYNGNINNIELVVGIFTIPKGSEYYQTTVNRSKNVWTCLVSNQLIFRREL